MKFDVFNKDTWIAEKYIDPTEVINNKAVGHIGQMIRPIRELKETLIKKSELDKQTEYQIAIDLENLNPAAFKLMNINYIFPENKINPILCAIDIVLSFWAVKDNREEGGWRTILPQLEILKPYIKESSKFFDSNVPVEELSKIEVHGNAAWEAYKSAMVDLGTYQKSYKESLDRISSLRKTLGADTNDSDDSSDDSIGGYDDE